MWSLNIRTVHTKIQFPAAKHGLNSEVCTKCNANDFSNVTNTSPNQLDAICFEMAKIDKPMPLTKQVEIMRGDLWVFIAGKSGIPI